MIDGDSVLYTVDLSIDNVVPILAIYAGGKPILERGHIENNIFVVDESETFTDQNLDIRKNLDITNGVVQLWRVRPSLATGLQYCNTTNVYSDVSNSYSQQPVVEIRGKFDNGVNLSAGNRSFGTRYVKSISLDFGANENIMYLANQSYWLERLVINGTGKITNISFAFNNIQNPYVLDFLNNMDLSACEYARNPFGDAIIDMLDLSQTGFNTQDANVQSYFLYGNPRIRVLNLSNIDFGVNMVLNNQFCQEYYPPKLYESNIILNNATSLSKSSLLRIIDALPETTTTVTLTIGSINMMKLTDAEIAIATEKGWTVV